MPTHPDSVSEGLEGRGNGHVEQIWDVQQILDQSTGRVSVVQRIQSLYEKAVLDVPTTVL